MGNQQWRRNCFVKVLTATREDPRVYLFFSALVTSGADATGYTLPSSAKRKQCGLYLHINAIPSSLLLPLLQLIGGISANTRNNLGHTVLQTLCRSSNKSASFGGNSSGLTHSNEHEIGREDEEEEEAEQAHRAVACAQELIR